MVTLGLPDGRSGTEAVSDVAIDSVDDPESSEDVGKELLSDTGRDVTMVGMGREMALLEV